MMQLTAIFLLFWLCQTADSNGVFSIRLDRYDNPNMALNSEPETVCDTNVIGDIRRRCDMRCLVYYKFGSYVEDHDTGEHSDALFVSNIYSKTNIHFDGPFPTALDNWQLRLEIRDIDPINYEMVDDFTMNDAFRQIRSTSFNGKVPDEGYVTVSTDRRYGRVLTWSYQIYCSTNYYSGLCDKLCVPTNDDAHGHYSCDSIGDKVCLPGYRDPSTNCIYTYCSPNPCLYGGTCNAIAAENRYTCSCTAAYTGKHCELVRDPCATSAPCVKGTCANPSIGTYVCTCHSGWNGTNCDADINECLIATPGKTCSPDGTANCSNLIGSFSCQCRTGWNGTLCSEITDRCLALMPCRHGNCSNTGSNYTCACDSGWTGTNCDTDIDECAAGGSLGGCYAAGTAACVNLNGSFACQCRPGWSGSLCNNITDYCLAVGPCQHGRCSNTGSGGGGNYSCACDSGWSGANCDADIDECSVPGYCHMENAVSCVNTNGSYACNCRPGYEGLKCDTKVGPCDRKPCQHGNCSGDASGSYSGYNCTCQSGWSGRNCSEDQDECLTPDQCSRLQACVNLPGGYRCDPTVSSYWYVFLIIILLLLVAAGVITAWRVLVCRNERLHKRHYGSAETVSVRKPTTEAPRNVKWPVDDRKTLDDWTPDKAYNYNSDGRSPSLPPRNANRPLPAAVQNDANGQAAAEVAIRSRQPALPALTESAIYEQVGTEGAAAAAAAGATGLLEASGPYSYLRESKMLASGEAAEAAAAMQQSGPKPRLPDAPRPVANSDGSSVAAAAAASALVVPANSSVYDNSGYLHAIEDGAAPPLRPVSNPGYLVMTSSPEGYCQPVVAEAAAAAPQSLAPPSPQQLPPKPPKVKRPKAKANSAAPPPPKALKPKPKPKPAASAASAGVPTVSVVDVDVEVDFRAADRPPGSVVERLNSGDANAAL